jgi:chitodextrinase
MKKLRKLTFLILAMLLIFPSISTSVLGLEGPDQTNVSTNAVSEIVETIDDKFVVRGTNDGQKLEISFFYQNIAAELSGAQLEINLNSALEMKNGSFAIATATTDPANPKLETGDTITNAIIPVDGVYRVMVGGPRLAETPAGQEGVLGKISFNVKTNEAITVTFKKILVNQWDIDNDVALRADNVTMTFPGPPDTEVPSDVTNLQVGTVTHNSVDLSWTASASLDTVGYEIYKNQETTPIASVTGNTYTVTGLNEDTDYSFTVKAKDGAGNLSNGVSVNAKTLLTPDTTPPADVTGLTATPAATTVELSWAASSSSDVAYYLVYKGTDLLTTLPATATSYTATDLAEKTSYTFKLVAKDQSGNLSNGVLTSATTTDGTAPIDVTGLTSSNVTDTSVTLTWTASTSDDVDKYIVYKNGTELAQVTGTSYEVTGLSPETTYTFVVKAKDATGNESVGTAPLTVTTLDLTAPTVTFTGDAEGLYNRNVTVTLATDADATIYYTLDGSEPTASSTRYTQPISISETTTLKYVAIDEAGNTSNVGTKAYTIDKVAPTLNDILASGSYDRVQTITVTTQTDAKIYFTTDNSTPTKDSEVYNGPITLKQSGPYNYKFIAIDDAGNVSAVVSRQYTLNLTLTVNEVTVNSTVVTGRATPGETITVVNEAGTEYGPVTVSEDGTYSVTIPKQLVGAFLTVKTSSGNEIKTIVLHKSIDECFIATAAFGTKFGPAVTLLRSFRDDFLLTNTLGSQFVEFYYNHSPKIANFIADNEALKLGVRIGLSPIVGVVYMMYHPLLLIALLGLGALVFFKFRRRKMELN